MKARDGSRVLPAATETAGCVGRAQARAPPVRTSALASAIEIRRMFVMGLPVLGRRVVAVVGWPAAGVGDGQTVQLTGNRIEQLRRFARGQRARIAPCHRGLPLAGRLTRLPRNDTGALRRRLFLLGGLRRLGGPRLRSVLLIGLRVVGLRVVGLCVVGLCARRIRGGLALPILLWLAAASRWLIALGLLAALVSGLILLRFTRLRLSLAARCPRCLLSGAALRGRRRLPILGLSISALRRALTFLARLALAG